MSLRFFHTDLVIAGAMVMIGFLLPCQAELLPPGNRQLPPDVHAWIHATVVVSPEKTLTNATLVVRRGRVEAVGTDITPPPDARVWDLAGLRIYPGFIEPYLVQGGSASALQTGAFSPIRQSAQATSGAGIRFFGVPGEEQDPGNPGAGSEWSNVTPEKSMADAFTVDSKIFEEMRDLGFTVACLVPDKGLFRGQSALIALGEANPNELLLRPRLFQHIVLDPESGKDNAYPKSLMGVLAVWRQTLLDAQHWDASQKDYESHSRERTRPPFNPSFDALQSAIQGKQRVLVEPGSALMMSRASKIAREFGLSYALVACGQEWRRLDLMESIDTTFVVPLNFPSAPKLPSEEDWEQIALDDLRAWDWAPENPVMLKRKGRKITFTTHGLGDRSDFRKNLRRAIDRGMEESEALAALTTIPAELCGVSDQMGTLETGKLANLTIVEGGGYFDPESRVREVWVDGKRYASKSEANAPKKDKEAEATDKAKQKANAQRDLEKQRVAHTPLEGRGPLTTNDSVFVRGATVWTSGPEGNLENASLWVEHGKFRAIGVQVTLPEELRGKILEIDGRGLHVTPGIIDAHNHSMILGLVNESTLPSTAMVRIADVINSEAPTLHEQLAGGLTVANELHGSANPIGGQNAVIKLKDGASPDDLIFAGAPPGIKFALGENVKQSNWGERNVTRFPQTRMGVPIFYENRFTAAQQYLQSWEQYRKGGGLAPRRDLELEALGEILQGKRLIHCHSYRQDEILAFLRVMERFHIQVATLQHVLEGYKIADEIARHGAGGSCFSDWWGYKFEVYDAIPYAGSLMRERGVVVSFNSDSSDLARRLNLEAAKAVKYGNTPEIEALKFVTLSPAKQLHVADRVGSLEVGKDGDFAIWSKSPLDSTSQCLQTWIEGRKYFDRSLEKELTERRVAERTKLIEKAKKMADGGGESAGSEPARASFFRQALETSRRYGVLHCQDCQQQRSAP